MTTRTKPDQPRRRRRLRLFLICTPLFLAGALLCAFGALTCRPSWYQPASISRDLLEVDKHAQLKIENNISAALNGNSPVVVEISERQANRWIAARDELWPGETPSLAPFQQPQINFLADGGVRLAALVEQSNVRTVLSATFRFELSGDDLTITWDDIRAGVLPAPGKLLDQAAAKLADRLHLGPRALAKAGLTLPNHATWPNGKRRFRVTSIVIERGTARVTLEPLTTP